MVGRGGRGGEGKKMKTPSIQPGSEYLVLFTIFVRVDKLRDPASGVAVAIRDAAGRITVRPDTLETIIKGRCVSIDINIDEIKYRVCDICIP